MGCSPRVLRALLSLACFAGSNACAGAGDQSSNPTAASAAVEHLVLATEPSLRIGGQDERPEYFIQYTSGAFRLSDGRIVVADDGTREIRYFDRDGNHVRTVGGPGEGPGEFRRLRTVAVLEADTLFAWDLIQSRGTLFSPEGDVVRTLTLSSLPGIQQELQSRSPRHRIARSTVYALRSDRIAVEPFPEPMPQTLPETLLMQDTMPLFLIDRAGENPLEIGPFPGTEWFKHQSMGGLPWGETLRVAAGDNVLYVGSTRDNFIRVISGQDGQERFRISLPLQAHSPTPEDVELSRSRLIERAVPDIRESMAAYAGAIPWPSTFPVFGQIRATRDGRLWVQAYQRPREASQEWLAFDESGSHVATLTMDRSLNVMDLGADYVLVQTADHLGVEELRLYHFEQRD